VPVLLARVDDRLIHGQVVHGWGRALGATRFVIVSDGLRADPDHAELYLLAVPEEARGIVVGVDGMLEPALGGELARERTILLFSDLETPLRLVEAGYPLPELNLGGLHHRPGTQAALTYVFLDDRDRACLRGLAARGVRVTAQDLPGNPVHAAATLAGSS
jgi:PTS system mannose-specific IIB component/fructoselysine and glucoselysine-specific PTS system IIB component